MAEAIEDLGIGQVAMIARFEMAHVKDTDFCTDFEKQDESNFLVMSSLLHTCLGF